MPSETVIEVRNVSKSYAMGKSTASALKDVCLSVSKGEMVGLYGRSGSGKTTLLNIMALLDSVDTGEVLVQNKSVIGMNDNQLSRIRNISMGFIFQNFNLIPVLNIYENVEYPSLLTDINKNQRSKQVREIIEAVGLTEYIHHRPDELSGGQRQRVAIARALINKPSVVFADELTSALDKSNGIGVMDLCKDLNSTTGTTFIFSSHDDLVASYCSRIVELDDGRIQTGDRHENINSSI